MVLMIVMMMMMMMMMAAAMVCPYVDDVAANSGHRRG